MTAMIGESALRARRKATRRARPGGEHTSGHLREVFAGPRPAQHELPATAAALPSPLDGSVPWVHRARGAAAFLLGVISRDARANPGNTHQRHLYQKLGARNRMEAVERARALGLLAPSSRRP